MGKEISQREREREEGIRRGRRYGSGVKGKGRLKVGHGRTGRKKQMPGCIECEQGEEEQGMTLSPVHSHIHFLQ